MRSRYIAGGLLKGSIAMLLVGCITLGLASGLAKATDPARKFSYYETEPNNNYRQADVLDLDYSPEGDDIHFTGCIVQSDTSQDWYRLRTRQDGTLAVTLSAKDCGQGEHVYFSLLNARRAEIGSATLTYNKRQDTLSTGPVIGAAYYYVLISSDGYNHNYDLTPEFTLIP